MLRVEVHKNVLKTWETMPIAQQPTQACQHKHLTHMVTLLIFCGIYEAHNCYVKYSTHITYLSYLEDINLYLSSEPCHTIILVS